MRVVSRPVIAVLVLAVSVVRIGLPDAPPPQAGFDGAWASTGDHSVVISGVQTQSSSDPHSTSPRGGLPSKPTLPVHEFAFDECLDDWNSSRGCFRALSEEEPPRPPGTDAAAGRAITIDDLAQFAPAPVATVAEPGNVGVAGMPTNFVAAAPVQTRAGTLFDRPISVRFTPVRFSFAFGDGTSATSNTGGQSWASLGQAQFTPTPTSHSYRERGTYSAHVTVHYTAEVDIGGGWFSVDGELFIDGPERQIRVYEAETALVARTCDEQPGAPGC